MIRSTFISDSVDIELAFGPGKPVLKMKIGSLIVNGLDNQLPLYKCTFESINVENSFRRVQEESYSTTLSFIQVPVIYHLNNESGQSDSFKVAVMISKEIKVFGSDSLSIWEMHFGNME